MKNFAKITFKDKEDAVNVNNDSKYVLTASNINEIKDVVNDLSDELSKLLTYERIFKYIRFNVSKGLEKNNFYSLKIELSKNINFENSFEIICYPTLTLGNSNYSLEEDSTSIFSIFKNGTWNSYKNLIFTSNDEDTEIKINVQSYLTDENDEMDVPFFGRYKLINLKTLKESDWFGFILGFSNYKNSSYFSSEFKELRIDGKTEIFGKSTNLYNLIGVDLNNNIINLNENTQFSIISQSTSSFTQNILSTPNIINEEIQIIKAECLYNEVTYVAYLPVYIKPLQIIQYYIDGPSKILENEEKEYNIKAICKDGKILDLTNESIISIESNNLRIQNRKQ